jgi:hypothetical protein
LAVLEINNWLLITIPAIAGIIQLHTKFVNCQDPTRCDTVGGCTSSPITAATIVANDDFGASVDEQLADYFH